MNLRPKRKISAEFSMASMTDIIFLLLIFFIVASTFISPNAIDVNLPSNNTPRPNPITIAVTVDKDNQYYVNNDLVEDDHLLSSLQEVLNKEVAKGKAKEEISIAIYGDIKADYEHIFNIVKIGKVLELKVLLATDHE